MLCAKNITGIHKCDKKKLKKTGQCFFHEAINKKMFKHSQPLPPALSDRKLLVCRSCVNDCDMLQLSHYLSSLFH